MKRIHIIGLPRSGTTALSEAIASKLKLPLIVEPIFLWTDGFRTRLYKSDIPAKDVLKRIRSRITILDKVYASHGGFVEKTPSSAFLAPVLQDILENSHIIVVHRDHESISRSLSRMVLQSKDGNMNSTETFFARKMKVRIEKVQAMTKTLGLFAGISAFFRFLRNGHAESIVFLKDETGINNYVGVMLERLSELEAGPRNSVLHIEYDDFRQDPDTTLEMVMKFCTGVPESTIEHADAPG